MIGDYATPQRVTGISGLDALYGSAWSLSGRKVQYK